MGYLNTAMNSGAAWGEIQQKLHQRVEVDLNEVSRVIELARRTPGLAQYEKEFHELSIFFEIATQYYQQNDPAGLSGLVEFWDKYRAGVMQRYTAITPVELRAADSIVADIFKHFLTGVPNERVSYSINATPLVYGGEGGLGGYYTHPPGWNRPFAIINLPHSAFDNVWQWLALPHETGHDTYATVEGLQHDIETALENRMTAAVQSGELEMSEVVIDLRPLGLDYTHTYTGAEFISTIWKRWANEAQADMLGLLSCGGAAIVALQQIIGFGVKDYWSVFLAEGGGIGDAPEEHPTSYVRNALNIAALRKISAGHNALADEIQTRFEALRPAADFVEWHITDEHVLARCPVKEMVKSAEIAADVILTNAMPSLGNKTYQKLIDFSVADQTIVDQMAELLVAGNPTFSQVAGGSPRHCLAATMFAFEKDTNRADVINRTFKHFI